MREKIQNFNHPTYQPVSKCVRKKQKDNIFYLHVYNGDNLLKWKTSEYILKHKTSELNLKYVRVFMEERGVEECEPQLFIYSPLIV